MQAPLSNADFDSPQVHCSRRTSRSERIASLIAEISATSRALTSGTFALESLQLVATHPCPPDSGSTFCDTFRAAASPRCGAKRRSQLLRQAEDQLAGIASLVIEPDLLRIALLEHAHELCPSTLDQLDVVRAYLRYAGMSLTTFDLTFHLLEDGSTASGHQRAVCQEGVGRHALQVVLTALAAASPCASRPLSKWPLEELKAAVLAIPSAYAVGRRGVESKERRMPLDADFQKFGAPLWKQLIVEINRRGAEGDTWSVPRHERSQAKLLLSLASKVTWPLAAQQAAPQDQAPVAPPSEGFHVICRNRIPRSSDRVDQDEIQRHLLLEQPLPITVTPNSADLAERCGRLVAEFPWARQAIEQIFLDLRARAALGVRTMGMPATLLVGPPGSGKSRLAGRLAAELQLPCLDLALGGISDSKVLSGTSRGWASGRPSDIAVLLAARRCASALVILDEIDKATGSTSNDGGIQSYLLALLEPETARRHRDNFLKVECDFSNVLWIATANRLSVLPAPLLSRFRVLLVGQPRAEHMQAVAENVVAELAARWGMDRQALPDLSELGLPFEQLASVRQVRLACEAAVAHWAANIKRH